MKARKVINCLVILLGNGSTNRQVIRDVRNQGKTNLWYGNTWKFSFDSFWSLKVQFSRTWKIVQHLEVWTQSRRQTRNAHAHGKTWKFSFASQMIATRTNISSFLLLRRLFSFPFQRQHVLNVMDTHVQQESNEHKKRDTIEPCLTSVRAVPGAFPCLTLTETLEQCPCFTA